jgi:hypothetical protein
MAAEPAEPRVPAARLPIGALTNDLTSSAALKRYQIALTFEGGEAAFPLRLKAGGVHAAILMTVFHSPGWVATNTEPTNTEELACR